MDENEKSDNLICRIFGHTSRIQSRSHEHSLVWTICRRCGDKL